MSYFLAIDIGALSGRHIIGKIENGEIILEEIYRFKNGFKRKKGQLCWDLNNLFHEIKIGLKKCQKINKIPRSLGIDTWGVDFIILDKEDNLLGDSVSYRDTRTNGIKEKVFKVIEDQTIYKKTGIQFMDFNTLYQLKSIETKYKEKASTFLMIPDYFNFLLTGKKVNEYTNVTTTQMFNIKDNKWDTDLIKLTGFKENIFLEPLLPMTNIGGLRKDIAKEVGFQCEVILPPTHNTGAAFLASALDIHENGAILSSGTWSLFGRELKEPKLCKESLKLNFTNEGGYDKRYRFLKNIMGLWIIQEVARNLDYQYSFSQLVNLAKESKDFTSIIDVNDERFFASENMIEEIVEYCKETGQVAPVTVGEVSICVYRSLAKSYKKCMDELTKITGMEIDKINVIGGGCKNEFLNELIAKETKKEVIAGPVEAKGLGNIITQMLSLGEINNLNEAKKLIKKSISIGEKI